MRMVAVGTPSGFHCGVVFGFWFLATASVGDNIDNRDDVGDIHRVVSVHVSPFKDSGAGDMVDGSHDIGDIHPAVVVHVAFQGIGWCS